MDQRESKKQTVTAGTTVGASSELYLTSFAGGLMVLPSTTSATTLTFYVSSDEGATWRQVYNSSNAAVSRTVTQNRAYTLPDELFAATRTKIVSDVEVAIDVLAKE